MEVSEEAGPRRKRAGGHGMPPGRFLRPDAAKQSRHSYVYVFRGGATATMDLFDIAGGATGAWAASVVYGGSGRAVGCRRDVGLNDLAVRFGA